MSIGYVMAIPDSYYLVLVAVAMLVVTASGLYLYRRHQSYGKNRMKEDA